VRIPAGAGHLAAAAGGHHEKAVAGKPVAAFYLSGASFPDLRLSPISKVGVRYVATGTVKWFNATKGYGFIAPEGGGKDVFVHVSAVEKAGLNDLREGDKVTYDVVANRGKESAENLQVK
jgi:cold shock protein